MSHVGFFTRQDAKAGALTNKARRSTSRDLPIEELHRLGERGVRDLNPRAMSPNMPASGSKRPVVYILGEAPGQEDDQVGKQFEGKAGEKLRDYIPHDPAPIRWNNVCRTRPPDGRPPATWEAECFRPSVEADIARTKPRVLLAAGKVPTCWALHLPFEGKAGIDVNIYLARGRYFPIQIGGHKLWMYPVHHPSYILRVKDARDDRKVPGFAVERTFARDIARVFGEAEYLPKPIVEDPSKVDRGLHYLTKSASQIEAVLGRMARSKTPVAIDIETVGFRPYGSDAVIQTVAVGTYNHTYAFPLNHSDRPWSSSDKERIMKALHKLLKAPCVKIAQNLSMEMEWFAYTFKDRELCWNTRWDDTMVQAYILDERPGGHNLDFLCMLNMGLRIKSQSDGEYWAEARGGLDKLLRSNAIDTKYTWKLSKIQRRKIKAEGLTSGYRDHMPRVAATVLSQIRGIPIDVRVVEKLQRKVNKQVAKTDRLIGKSAAVKKYKSRFGSFNPNSDEDLKRLFKDLLRRNEGEYKDNGKYHVDKESLAAMAANGVKLAAHIRDRSKALKQLSTYVNPIHPSYAKSVVWPDLKLHPKFKVTWTRSMRLSVEFPSVQNWPKREDAWVREVLTAPEGWVYLAVDYGQIEGRVIAIMSGDPRYQKSIWKNTDVHMLWAKRIIERYPDTFERRGGDLKKFRGDLKGQWTFPLFYNSSTRSVANALEMPMSVAEELVEWFWDDFKRVKEWHKELLRGYDKNGYVETSTGKRRHGPISPSMIINSPVQGTASDIVVKAMERCSRYALKTGKWYYQPLLNIHDDLTFLIPLDRKDKVIDRIVRMMLYPYYSWINVPISVEVAEGPHWGSLEETGVYTSDQYYNVRRSV